MFKPAPDHSIRASYNRAFRSPSVINNYLDQDISNPQPTDLRPLGALLPPPLRPLVPAEPFFLTVNNFGNTDLQEENIDAFELAYTGAIGDKTMVGLAVYQNDTDNNINFSNLFPPGTPGFPSPTFYTVQSPAKGIGAVSGQPITLSPVLMGILEGIPPAFGGPIRLPYQVATYLNLGPIRNRGFEASVEHRVNNRWSLSGNYSSQDEPEWLDPSSDQIPYPIKEIGVPATNRFNAAVSYNGPRFLGNLNVNYSDEAFWNDVLSEPYHGFTDSYTMLNATLGVKFADGKATFSLRGTNLLNQDILQHIYGDLLKMSVVAELRFFTR
jgi:outer membrane receptor protein involved in Fe transport